MEFLKYERSLLKRSRVAEHVAQMVSGTAKLSELVMCSLVAGHLIVFSYFSQLLNTAGQRSYFLG